MRILDAGAPSQLRCHPWKAARARAPGVYVTNVTPLETGDWRLDTPASQVALCRLSCMEQVSFIAMEDGTKEEYEFLVAIEGVLHADYVDRVLEWLQWNEGDTGYRISRFEHGLQSATRAHRDGRDEEFVVCCLLHDIGDFLSPFNHSQLAAAILAPYVSEKNHWIIKQHGVFQGYYYFHHFGQDRNARDRFKDHEWYDDAVDFCARYDQNCFDPEYENLPLEFFEPMVRRVFATRIHETP